MYSTVKKTLIASLALTCALLALSGCTRDPNIRKQKYLASGQRYMAKGKYREAAIQFANALRLDSKYGDAHYQLALCDLKLNAVHNAYVELVRTTFLQPDNLQAQLDLGNLLLAGHDFKRAEDRADLVIAKDANNVSAHILKANANAGQHLLDQALTEMNTAVQLDPKRSASYLNLGVIEVAKTPASADAEANFKKAIEFDGSSVPARLTLAGFYDNNKRYSEAEQQIQEAIKLAPRNQQAHAALVAHYLTQGQKDLAEKAAKDTKSILGSDPEGAQFLGRYYFSVNDIKSATEEYRQLSQQFPNDRQIQHAYLDLVIPQGQNDLAMKQVNFILKKFPKDSQALTDKGLILLEQNKPSEARDVLQGVVKADAQNAVALFQLGNTFRALGDLGQAETEWREAVRVQPGYLLAERTLGSLALTKRDFGTLAKVADTLKTRFPNLADGYQMQAEVDLSNNDAKSAESNLQKAISLDTSDSMLYVQLGQLLNGLHRSADAEKTLEEALRADPQQPLALRTLVQIDLAEKQPERATNRVRQVIAQFPQNGPAHLLMGELAVDQKNLQLAESEFAQAVNDMPHEMKAYTNLGSVQVSRNENAQAEATYQKAVENNPNDPSGYWLLATLQDQEKKTAEAEKNYRKAIELRPDFGTAANNLAYLMLQNGENIDQIISYAEIARRQMPNVPAVADTLGWAYYQKGTAGLAIQMLEDAVREMPSSATYHYHLGMAYSKNGDRQKAKNELQRAVQLESIQSKKEEMRKSLASLG